MKRQQKTLPFHGCNPGSNPGGDAKQKPLELRAYPSISAILKASKSSLKNTRIHRKSPKNTRRFGNNSETLSSKRRAG